MSWLVFDAAFDVVVAEDSTWLQGYTYRHEWISLGEAATEAEVRRLQSFPLRWEIRPRGSGKVRYYLELDGRSAPERAATAVRAPNGGIVVIAEVDEVRWASLLHAFEVFAAAPFPKHFRISVPFELLSSWEKRTAALEEFLAGTLPNGSTEEVTIVFRYGAELPEMRA
ncbi:MAG: hypothetical protein ABS35_34025 [Kaistia sp. SCN 65-12]|jgi:hypothetical protein|nr:MAG: hypothetical protein ABS35_34025 [Kaistia sp. SCN 65-12]